ncbi:MAG TPA: anti-sigma factor [Candidatus Udaeobacter sp.]|nr:anti-sigma factor [Candidatus Udaeobacter sp.]
MSEHRDEYLDLCAGYALGALDDADRRRLEAHLAEGCAECEAALADFSDSVVQLARSAPDAQPTPALRARVLSAVKAEGAGRGDTGADRARVLELKPRRTAWVAWTWAAAAVFLAIATAMLWNQADSLRSELAAVSRSLSDARRKLEADRSLIAVLSAPGARVAEMQITPAGVKELRARATYDPKTRSAVIVFENFTAPSGRDYQLWALRGAGVASLGVIKPDSTGRAIVEVADAGDPGLLAGFAVSLEPAGGSPYNDKPTGPVVMAGKFGT